MIRAKESQETASERGHALHKRIYGRNPEFDMNATPAASPDYAFVVRDLLYGRVFSFDEILNDLDTGYVILSTLIGIDCQYQLRNHMKGMLYNGATREELQDLLELCLGLAKRLRVDFRSQPRPVPHIDDGSH
jgi:alkylhydroperoxidase/carboxymuconolactone decarboxylase family protein YurZ